MVAKVGAAAEESMSKWSFSLHHLLSGVQVHTGSLFSRAKLMLFTPLAKYTLLLIYFIIVV